MRFRVKQFITLCFILFSICVFLTHSTYAQETVFSERTDTLDATVSATQPIAPIPTTPLNITLSPVSIFFETDPGKAVTNEIKIRNNGTESEFLQITIGTFTADSTGQKPVLLDPNPNDEYMQWLVPKETQFEVQPGEWKTIPITFSPSQTASLSYYYTIIVSRSTKLTPKGSETTIIGNPSILVLTTVQSPNARRELQLVDFETNFPLVEFLPISFKIRVRNTGNVHSIPSGNIFIDGQGKQDVGIFLVNPKRSAILPQTEKNYEVAWDDGFPLYEKKEIDGKEIKNAKNEQEYTLKWDFSKADRFRFGKYTAHLLMVYDNGERDIPIESFVSFWVLPWKILLVLGLLLLFILFGVGSVLYLVVSKLRKKKKIMPPLNSSPRSLV